MDHLLGLKGLYLKASAILGPRNESSIETGTHRGTDGAVEGEGGVVAVVDALLVDVAHVQLHGAVVLRGDELVGPRAVPQQDTIRNHR